MGCSDQILPHIKHTVDPAEMWDFLDDGFDNTLSKLGRTQILREFHACHPGIDEKMNTYFNRLIDYRNQLSGSAEEISEDSFVTHIFTHIPKEFATTINIFERQAPPPTSQYIMDAIRLDKEKVSFVTEIAEASAGAALYSQRGGYCGCGCGGSGRFGRRKTYRLTYCKMDLQTTETCGKQKRAQSGNGNSVRTAIPVEMTALEETMLEEATRKRATMAGSQAISDPIVFTTNERRKHETQFEKAQLQSTRLEIEIPSDYPVMLSPPPPPIQLGSLIPWPLTMCATIAACSSHSTNYAELCSLNLAMITQ